MATETALARAKVNLCLHVTGQRADGYHLLDSLVVFAEAGDVVAVRASKALTLAVTGPRAAALADAGDNLCLRAARAFGGGRAAAITLEKHLPVASGIGGGSADAAATLTVLARLWNCALPPADEVLRLGADVPVCLQGRTARMRGVGEVIDPLPALPPAWLVLVNPGVAVPTPAVFRGLTQKANAPLPAVLPAFPDAAALAGFLQRTRNDLAPPAEALAPVIATARQALAAQGGCLLARMSGSGATCFGLFATEAAAQAAASAMARVEPGWWVQAAAMAR